MIAPSASPYTSKKGTSTSAPKMMPRLYIDGARPGSQKFWCAYRMPITTPLTREDDRRDEQESHQVDSERLRGRAEAGREQIMHDRLGKHGGDDGGDESARR